MVCFNFHTRNGEAKNVKCKTFFFRKNPWKVILSCFQIAYENEFPFFALQFYGECWLGKSDTQDKYFLDGKADNCWKGVGGPKSNYVYHIGTPLGRFYYLSVKS